VDLWRFPARSLLSKFVATDEYNAACSDGDNGTTIILATCVLSHALQHGMFTERHLPRVLAGVEINRA